MMQFLLQQAHVTPKAYIVPPNNMYFAHMLTMIRKLKHGAAKRSHTSILKAHRQVFSESRKVHFLSDQAHFLLP